MSSLIEHFLISAWVFGGFVLLVWAMGTSMWIGLPVAFVWVGGPIWHCEQLNKKPRQREP
jgi:hypothetical protein